LRDVFLGVLYLDRLDVETDERPRPDFEDVGMEPIRPNERQTPTSCDEVAPKVSNDPEALLSWARESVGAIHA
jgi:DNA transformation protein and related proteins